MYAPPPAVGGGAGGSSFTPPAPLPSPAKLAYLANLLQVLLIGLALPYLIYRMLTDPIDTIRAVGRGHEG